MTTQNQPDQLNPSPAVSSLQNELVKPPTHPAPASSILHTSPSQRPQLPSELIGVPQSNLDPQTWSQTVLARALIPQLHRFAFPSNFTHGEQVLFGPSPMDPVHIVSDSSLPTPAARIVSLDLFLKVQLWKSRFGPIYEDFHSYIRVDKLLAILHRFQRDQDNENRLMNDWLKPWLDKLCAACQIGLVNLQHRQRYRSRFREYCEIRLTMHMFMSSRILVESVNSENGMIGAVLKAWDPHGPYTRQACLHFETDRGEAMREIADLQDTIEPAYKTFKFPPLFANDVKVHSYPGPQYSSGSGDGNAVEQQVCATTCILETHLRSTSFHL